MEQAQKQQQYRETLKSYAAMIDKAADSPEYVELLVIGGANLTPFEKALRNHIEQFIDDAEPLLRGG